MRERGSKFKQSVIRIRVLREKKRVVLAERGKWVLINE